MLGPFPRINADYLLGLTPSVRKNGRTVLRDFSLKAAGQFKSQIPEQVSLANFIYELKEFKDLFPKLKELSLKKDALKNAGGNYLRYDFGWKPFIGDLEKLANLINEVTKRIEYLKSQNGKTRVLKARKQKAYEISDTIPGPPASGPWGSSPSLESVHQNYEWERSHTTSLYASTTLFQYLEGLDDANTMWRALFASLGFNSPGAILWNALPFSFVLDWMIPVGDWLSLFSIEPFMGAWHFSDVCLTSKEVTTLKLFYLGGPTTQVREHIGTWKIVRYDRSLGLHTTYEDLFSGLGDLSFSNWADAVALILGNTGKKH